MPRIPGRPRRPAPQKKTRAPRGTGTVFYNKRRRYWVGRLPVGRDAKGRTTYLERTGKTQAEVVRKLKAAGPPGPDTTVAEWAARWLDDLGVRDSTADGYRLSVAKRIVPHLGPVPVATLTPAHVERAARAWARETSPATARLTAAHLSACLGVAVRSGLIPANPVSRCKKPRAERKKVTPLPAADLDRVGAAASLRPNTLAIALLAATGMRVGEAIALDVPDFRPADGTIAITKTQPERKGRAVGPPKSPHSVRTIRVPAPAVPAVVAAIDGRKAGPLFRSRTGARLRRDGLTRSFARLLARLDLPPRNLHQLRHSWATAVVSDGSPIGDVARYLGDTVDTVVRSYLHPAGTDPADAVEKLFRGR